MRIKVNITTNRQAVNARFEEANKRALQIVSQQVLNDCNEHCPEDQHILVNSSISHSILDKGLLVWSTPYARMLYYGIVMVDPQTGIAGFMTENGWKSRKGISKVQSNREFRYSKTNACKLWCEKAKEEHNSEWQMIYQRALERFL